jgi:antitoxin PrlF
LKQRMVTSRLTKKSRTTIPIAVRTALRVEEGDELGYRIESGYVIMTKIKKNMTADPFATFHEWSSEADRLGYADL